MEMGRLFLSDIASNGTGLQFERPVMEARLAQGFVWMMVWVKSLWCTEEMNISAALFTECML